MKILVLNAGSSSQKSCLYELNEELPIHPPQPLWEGFIDWSYQPGVAEIKVKNHLDIALNESIPITSKAEIIAHLIQTMWQGETKVIDSLDEINIVGHRVVHGGDKYRESTLITPDVKQAIERFSMFAPVHNPANLEGIKSIENILGEKIPQIAVFDTAFHADLPEYAAVYPIPYQLSEDGIRRYGFHGISHQYVAQRTAQILGKNLAKLNLITCHLGNGCSLAAISKGRSIDTTMGFTPLSGLMMGARSGDIDPGILIYLIREKNYTAAQLDTMLNRQSGLQGVSGISNDMRKITEAMKQGNKRAKLAYDIYIHRLASLIGSMLASLGGIDALVFTAGVGENSAEIRSDVCQKFRFLGLEIDSQQNEGNPVDADIATPESSAHILVIHTEEDWAIAQECWKKYPS
jgi:acetate kinase